LCHRVDAVAACQRVVEIDEQGVDPHVEHRTGDFARTVEDALNTPILAENRRKAVVPIGLLEPSVADHVDALLIPARAVTAVHDRVELWPDHRGDIAPDLIEPSSERRATLAQQLAFIVFVVHEPHIRPPPQRTCQPAAHHQPDGSAELSGPAVDRPERGLRPVEGGNRLSQCRVGSEKRVVLNDLIGRGGIAHRCSLLSNAGVGNKLYQAWANPTSSVGASDTGRAGARAI
jgi:hypothetical protein